MDIKVIPGKGVAISKIAFGDAAPYWKLVPRDQRPGSYKDVARALMALAYVDGPPASFETEKEVVGQEPNAKEVDVSRLMDARSRTLSILGKERSPVLREAAEGKRWFRMEGMEMGGFDQLLASSGQDEIPAMAGNSSYRITQRNTDAGKRAGGLPADTASFITISVKQPGEATALGDLVMPGDYGIGMVRTHTGECYITGFRTSEDGIGKAAMVGGQAAELASALLGRIKLDPPLFPGLAYDRKDIPGRDGRKDRILWITKARKVTVTPVIIASTLLTRGKEVLDPAMGTLSEAVEIPDVIHGKEGRTANKVSPTDQMELTLALAKGEIKLIRTEASDSFPGLRTMVIQKVGQPERAKYLWTDRGDLYQENNWPPSGGRHGNLPVGNITGGESEPEEQPDLHNDPRLIRETHGPGRRSPHVAHRNRAKMEIPSDPEARREFFEAQFRKRLRNSIKGKPFED